MTFNDIFKSSFLENITSISMLDMIIALILAFLLGLFNLLLKLLNLYLVIKPIYGISLIIFARS